MDSKLGQSMPDTAAPTPAAFRFCNFEFDPETLQLRQNGSRRALKTLSARALLKLLQHAPRPVMREELAQHLWRGRNVDFENGINACIRDIRKALDDSAIDPKFVETIPKLGYKFIAPINPAKRGVSSVINEKAGVFWRLLRKPAYAIGAIAIAGVSIPAIMFHLQSTPGPAQALPKQIAAAAPTAAAMRVFLEGQSALETKNPDSVAKAASIFERALLMDPSFTAARAGLAKSLFLSASAQGGPEIATAIDNAIAADPENSDLFLLQARARWAIAHDWDGARESIEYALDLDPSSLGARMMLAHYHVIRRDFEAAAVIVADARAINPVELTKRGDAGWIFYMAGDNDTSKDLCAQTALLTPTSAETARCYFDVYMIEKDIRRAVQAATTYMRALGAPEDEVRALITAPAPQALNQFIDWHIQRNNKPHLRNSPERIMRAINYVILERFDDAMEEIAVANAERDYFLPFVFVIPELAPLRARADFRALERDLGLAPPPPTSSDRA